MPASEIAKQFGEQFAATLGGLPPGQWQGPVESGYGAHLVLVSERTEGRLPALADVRDAVRREWANARRLEGEREVLPGAAEALHRDHRGPRAGEGAEDAGGGEMKRALLCLLLLAAFAPARSRTRCAPRISSCARPGRKPTTRSGRCRVSARDLRLGLYVELPAGCTNVTEPRASMVNNAYTERWTVKCAGGLTGGTIHIAGLTRDDDRRARAPGTPRRHHASHAPHAVRSVVRRRSRAARAGGRPHLPRARRRTHPRAASTICCSCLRC